MATNRKASPRSAKSTKPAANRPVSFEQAALLCPTEGQAERVAEKFGLTLPDYQAIRQLHARTLLEMADGFAGALNDKATQMHFQRIVGSLVSSAVGAGRFYSEKVSEARAAAARAADGGEEPDAPVGFESRALRIAEFAADMAMQAFALLAAAHGAVEAFKEITGDDWVAYQAHDEAKAPSSSAPSRPSSRPSTPTEQPKAGPSGPAPLAVHPISTPALTLDAGGDVASGCRTRSPAALSRLNPCANIACAAFGVGAVALRPSRCDATKSAQPGPCARPPSQPPGCRCRLKQVVSRFRHPPAHRRFGPHQEFRSPSARTARTRNPTLRPRLRQTWSWRDVSTRRPLTPTHVAACLPSLTVMRSLDR